MSAPAEYQLDETEVDHLAALLAHRRATRTPVDADECATFRRRVRDGVPLADVAHETGRSTPAVRHHARGRCDHSVDEAPTSGTHS